MPVLLHPPRTGSWVCFSDLGLGWGLRILSEQKSYTLALVLLVSLPSLLAFAYLWEEPLDLSIILWPLPVASEVTPLRGGIGRQP